MRNHRVILLWSALAGMTLLTACGQSGDTASVGAKADPAIKSVIEARQEALKDVGGAFKAIADQLKASSPEIGKIQIAAASVPRLTADMADWFPSGSGPESGVETEALAVIWKNESDFLQKVSAMQDAAANLNTAAQTGDVAAIGAAFKKTGGTCKGCHDKYRLDD